MSSSHDKIRLTANIDENGNIVSMTIYKRNDKKGNTLQLLQNNTAEFNGTESSLKIILEAANLIAALMQSTKHDKATYRTAYASLAVDGNIVAGLEHKRIKIHWMFGHAAAAVEGNFRDANGGNIIGHFKFNDREGFCPSFCPYPAAMFRSAVGGAFYCDYTTAAQAYWMVVYTDADAE